MIHPPALPSDSEWRPMLTSPFAMYRFRKAKATITAHRTQVNHLARLTGLTGLWDDEAAWRDVSAPLVTAAIQELLKEGRSIAGVNLFYASIRKYTQLAREAGMMDEAQERAILSVGSIPASEARNIDAKRGQTRIPGTRRPSKERILSIDEQLHLLQQPDSCVGRRDSVIMALLLLCGLRIGEVVTLDYADVDLASGLLRVRRHKTGTDQTLALGISRHLIGAFRRYLAMPIFAPGSALLLHGDAQQRLIPGTRIGYDLARRRVTKLARKAGIPDFSPHDARATWATMLARAGNSSMELKAAGGWKSITTAERYIADAAIANAGIKLPEELR